MTNTLVTLAYLLKQAGQAVTYVTRKYSDYRKVVENVKV